MISKLIVLLVEYWYLGILIAGFVFKYLYEFVNHQTGEYKRREFETDRSLEQLRDSTKRSHEKQLGEAFDTKRVRNGFWGWSDNFTFSVKKKSKTGEYK